MNFRVELDAFRGPLDLLLYLVRKHEIDAADISLANVTSQYLDSLAAIQELNVDDVGDFLDVASTLLEIKSRVVLPQGGEELDELEETRNELVQRLLEYKHYKDAASLLDEQSRDWQQRYARQTDDLPPREIDLGSQRIQEVELWDLVSALGRVLRENQATQPSNIVYDDTPIQVYMERIHRQVAESGEANLSQWFQAGMHKSAMIGVFLAILELVRHHHVCSSQDELHGEIRLLAGEGFDPSAEFSHADSYGPPAEEESLEQA